MYSLWVAHYTVLGPRVAFPCSRPFQMVKQCQAFPIHSRMDLPYVCNTNTSNRSISGIAKLRSRVLTHFVYLNLT